jgi:hypothetical protein
MVRRLELCTTLVHSGKVQTVQAFLGSKSQVIFRKVRLFTHVLGLSVLAISALLGLSALAISALLVLSVLAISALLGLSVLVLSVLAISALLGLSTIRDSRFVLVLSREDRRQTSQ